MASEIKDRRNQHRCAKEVGMHCSFLHGDTTRLVIIRNYSTRGIYFESYGKIQLGTIIVLRTVGASDFSDNQAASNAPLFIIENSDPEVCTRFRSHVLAKVQRCVKLDGSENMPRYCVGAEIQILSDY